jgi:hypothetical protein
MLGSSIAGNVGAPIVGQIFFFPLRLSVSFDMLIILNCNIGLSGLSVQLADSECNTACDGNQTEACGGALKLSVYNITTNGSPAMRMDAANIGFWALALTVYAGLF